MNLTDAEYAYLRSQLGEADRIDLDTRYQRLDSLQAVAIEVLRERKAALASDPLAVTVQEVATVNNAENVKAIERQIAETESSARAATPNAIDPVRLVRARAR
ncbi:hypothetical protein [Streptomyces sp. DHE17-7]|uniref:hypothetical protein n=1 Tax=Streptomyces sp. DHE17-7 TaxID=2759949 RepID=UPI000EC0E4B7|nr:hypothetical protein [Streptomyces sp. DHE17-7]MBJ6620026.1 hypothetical protein [Streptomyces sp. DHE17-7]RIH61297.1 hypothetical protein D3C59_11380 [Streptomyces sp. SHP22-7]